MSLTDLATKHGVPEVVIKVTALNVSTFLQEDPLVFLSLCTALKDKWADPRGPVPEAVNKWALGTVSESGQLSMTSIVEDVIREIESNLMDQFKGTQ